MLIQEIKKTVSRVLAPIDIPTSSRNSFFNFSGVMLMWLANDGSCDFEKTDLEICQKFSLVLGWSHVIAFLFFQML